MQSRAADVMITDVHSVHPDWPLQQLADFLVEHAISGVPVTSPDGRLLGVVSSTDIVRHAGQMEEPIRGPVVHNSADPQPFKHLSRHGEVGPGCGQGQACTVADIMTREVQHVDEQAGIREVAALMIRSGIHRVFVTSGEKLLGVVSTMDLMELIRDNWPPGTGSGEPAPRSAAPQDAADE